MSIRTFTPRELANVAVFFGASAADLALVSSAHAAAQAAWYNIPAPEPASVEAIEAEAAKLRAEPHLMLDFEQRMHVAGGLPYNARIPTRDWTAEEPWKAAFRRIDRAVGKKTRAMVAAMFAGRPDWQSAGVRS